MLNTANLKTHGPFQNDHSSGGLERTGTKRVEIETTGNGVAYLVFPIPICRVFPTQIASCPAVASRDSTGGQAAR